MHTICTDEKRRNLKHLANIKFGLFPLPVIPIKTSPTPKIVSLLRSGKVDCNDNLSMPLDSKFVLTGSVRCKDNYCVCLKNVENLTCLKT